MIISYLVFHLLVLQYLPISNGGTYHNKEKARLKCHPLISENQGKKLATSALHCWIHITSPNTSSQSQMRRGQGKRGLFGGEYSILSLSHPKESLREMVKLHKMVKDREARHIAVQGVVKSQTWIDHWTTTKNRSKLGRLQKTIWIPIGLSASPLSLLVCLSVKMGEVRAKRAPASCKGIQALLSKFPVPKGSEDSPPNTSMEFKEWRA